MTTFELRTFIAAPIEVVFDLARDIDLHARSMAHSHERAVAGRTSGRIDVGETVTWRARHFGIDWTLTSRITECVAPHRFVDEQLAGPFASFCHVHRFEACRGGTLMVEEWTHFAPMGPLGRLVDRLVLARYMRRLLERRNAALKAEAERVAGLASAIDLLPQRAKDLQLHSVLGTAGSTLHRHQVIEAGDVEGQAEQCSPLGRSHQRLVVEARIRVREQVEATES